MLFPLIIVSYEGTKSSSILKWFETNLYFCKKNMGTVYTLSSCDTCRKILKSLPENDLKVHDIKQNPLTIKEVERMHALSGSYETLFSKKAQLYKSLGLKDKNLTENDFKNYILEHYTFLSRPVFIINNEIFIGNSKKNIETVISTLANV